MGIRTRAVAAVTSMVLAAALTGCTSDSDPSTGESAGTPAAGTPATGTDATQPAAAVLAANTANHAVAGDTAWSSADAVTITLAGGSATTSGNGVTVDGGKITITAAGTYRITGTLTGGQLLVDAGDATVKLVLDGAEISSTTGAAIAATKAGKVVVILADGSANTLADTETYAADAEVNAALYSAADLTIAGNGELTVHGNGNDGITGKDGLVIASGTVTVDAADDGIRGKDYLVVTGGTITVTAGGDGLKADNTEQTDAGYIAVSGGNLTVTAAGDGADATTDLVFTAGTMKVTVGGGSKAGGTAAGDTSAKGLKSGVITVLEGGTVSVDAADDALHGADALHLNGTALTLASGGDAVHADNSLVIDKGTVDVTASVEGLESKNIAVNGGDVHVVASDDGMNAADGTGNEGGRRGGEEVGAFTATITGGTLVIDAESDGLDSNGVASMTGGTVVVSGPVQRNNGAIDVNGTFQISGGVLVATGSVGVGAADSKQGWVSATFTSTVAAGTTLHVVDADGKVIATFVAAEAIQNLVYSSSAVTSGSEYRIYTGGKATGTKTGGLAQGGTLGSATLTTTVVAGQAPTGG